jgi:hypothetical protein
LRSMLRDVLSNPNGFFGIFSEGLGDL